MSQKKYMREICSGTDEDSIVPGVRNQCVLPITDDEIGGGKIGGTPGAGGVVKSHRASDRTSR